MPCKTLSFSSPYLLLYNKVPELQSLRIFGSAVFPWIKPFNNHKLQFKSKMCIFLGYAMGYKGIICYDQQSKKCIISRHVIFEESIFPAKLGTSHSGEASAETVKQISYVIIPFPMPMSTTRVQSEHGQPSELHHVGTSVSHSSPHVSINPQNRICEDSSASTSDSSYSTTSDTPTPPPLLPVLDSTQLQVLLPFSESSSSDHTNQTNIQQFNKNLQACDDNNNGTKKSSKLKRTSGKT